MQTISSEDRARITEALEGMYITEGRTREDRANSMAAINLGLIGGLTDKVPDCMSPIIGLWIMRTQNEMPSVMRNSPEWRSLLPFAAGTGQGHEKERSQIILDWMWVDVLPQLQSLADERGFGAEWSAMCNERTRESAKIARVAASRGVSSVADASFYAGAAAARATDAADDDFFAATSAAVAVAHAVSIDGDGDAFWAKIKPVELLTELIEVTHKLQPIT